MVRGLFGGEAGDGGQDTESIATQHDNVGWLSVGDTWNLGVGNVLDGVGTSSVFGDADIVVIGDSVSRVVDDVFENRSKLDGTVNLWLLLSRQVDRLGVTTTLNVENTSVGPDVLVVTDKQTVGVGGKSRLSGTGETEEEGNVAVVSLGLVGGRVKRKLAKLDRLQVVHDGEDTLLHLTSVFGTENDHLHSLEVDLNRGGGSHTGGESVGGELTGVVDDKVGFTKVSELLGRGSDQHVVHEQGVVGSGSDDSDLDSVFWVPTREAVEDVDVFPRVQVVDGTFSVDLESVLAGC